jgi:sarcosine oxidase delta subunit
MTAVPTTDVILGVTHLLVDGELTQLLKCPFCNFRNIHEDMITHHIKFTVDSQHKDIDIEQLDKGQYVVTRTATKESPYGPYLSKAELKIPWIRCLWCNYRDKIEFDLSLHMLEKHGPDKFADHKLLQLEIFGSDRKRTKTLSGDKFARFEGAIEFRLDVAVEMAKEENRGKGVRHAIAILQKRATVRRRAREGAF